MIDGKELLSECVHLFPTFLCRVCTPVGPREPARPARKVIPRYRPKARFDADDTDAAPADTESLPPAQFFRP